jgi:hypothetical protein
MSCPNRISRKPLGTLLSTGLIIAGLSACADGGPVSPTMDGAPAMNAQTPGPQDRGPLERVQFIHYRGGSAAALRAAGGGGEKTGGSNCYAFTAIGARWRTAEPWQVYNGSDDGISARELENDIATALASWESAAGVNIAGAGSVNGHQAVNVNTIDNLNVVQFGPVITGDAIAVTNAWGYFRGPVSTREIVEWDMLLDDQDFSWSDDGAPGAMDLLNVVAHEIGHAIGMGHPGNSCTEETMYAFSSEGETKKRSLNAGDIAGIQALY